MAYIRLDDLGLGIFSFPIKNFNERMGIAKATTPQMDEQARAARVYFGMLSEQPKPTREDDVRFINWGNSIIPKEEWLEREVNALKPGLLPRSYYVPISDNVDAQTAYFAALKNLQSWLSYYGLMEGIKKTLAEESRKKQAELASIQSSKAAAAQALAYSRINADMSEEARREAAENEGRAQKELADNLIKEAEIKQDLENLKAGYLVEKTAAGSLWPWVLLGAAAFYALGKNKSKRSKAA